MIDWYAAPKSNVPDTSIIDIVKNLPSWYPLILITACLFGVCIGRCLVMIPAIYDAVMKLHYMTGM